MSNLTLIEKNKNFNGFQYVYSHYSKSNKCELRFSIYLPNTNKKLPVLYFLSGLTCTEQNFIQKSGMQKYASKEEMIIVGPDTSPRGNQVPDLKESFLGKGAGFYLNATQLKWKRNYNLIRNIYKKPSKKSEVTSQIIYGEKIRILKIKKRWLKIKTHNDNYSGYIKNEKLKEG